MGKWNWIKFSFFTQNNFNDGEHCIIVCILFRLKFTLKMVLLVKLHFYKKVISISWLNKDTERVHRDVNLLLIKVIHMNASLACINYYTCKVLKTFIATIYRSWIFFYHAFLSKLYEIIKLIIGMYRKNVHLYISLYIPESDIVNDVVKWEVVVKSIFSNSYVILPLHII